MSWWRAFLSGGSEADEDMSVEAKPPSARKFTWFDAFFGSGSGGSSGSSSGWGGGETGQSRKIFRTSKEIHQALFKIRSLNQADREMIFDLIVRELDDGGVTVYEGQKKLNPIFYRLMKAGRISSTDYYNLKNLWQ